MWQEMKVFMFVEVVVQLTVTSWLIDKSKINIGMSENPYIKENIIYKTS